MIAVTIGVTPTYKKLATLSANCVKMMTGLDVLILSEPEFIQSGLPHAAALKLKIFDFVREENILYFDADWFCAQKWNPSQYKDSSSIIACTDFVLESDWPNQYHSYSSLHFDSYPPTELRGDIRSDYVAEVKSFSGINVDCLGWINTGFWIANRTSHQVWLDTSLKYYKGEIGHHHKYYEQPAMNMAIETLGMNIKYLSRKYNTLIATKPKWPDSLVGLHVKLKHHDYFVQQVLNNKITTVEGVKEYFFFDK